MAFANVAAAQGSQASEQIEQCPSIVAVAARGSEQNEAFEPTKYSDTSSFISNGYEAENLRALFQGLENYWMDKTGESIMEDILVMGLSPESFPARLPLEEPAITSTEFDHSLRTGKQGVAPAIEAYEQTSGCVPDYLFAGYSQGSLVLAGQDQKWEAQGRHVGTVLLADPAQAVGDPKTIGHSVQAGGLASILPRTQDTARTLRYCIDGDIVCDVHLNQAMTAMNGKESTEYNKDNWPVIQPHGNYFLVPRESDQIVYEQIGQWILVDRSQ